jgi:hypothetical protein
MTENTLTAAGLRDQYACYSYERLNALFPEPRSVLEVLENTEGPWETVPAEDRLWAVLRGGLISDRILRLFAADCAERAIAGVSNPDPASLKAVQVARRFAEGRAGVEELATAARSAAFSAALSAESAARSAESAARSAARSAAESAARSAAFSALSAESKQQVETLIALIKDETPTQETP